MMTHLFFNSIIPEVYRMTPKMIEEINNKKITNHSSHLNCDHLFHLLLLEAFFYLMLLV